MEDLTAATDALRIVHVIDSGRFAGVEQFVLRLAARQASFGHDVAVIGGARSHMADALAEAGVRWAPGDGWPAACRSLREWMPASDVVNTHMTSADVMAVALRAWGRSAAPIVSTRHFAQRRGTLGPGPLYRLVERRVAQEIAVSHVVARRIGVPSTVVHPGVDPTPPTSSPRLPVVLVAQRLQPEKHTELALRAFHSSGLMGRGWTLEVAGTGPQHPALARVAAELGIAGAVRFLGFRSDLPSLMRRSGMLIAPAPFEHFGLTVLEAMSHGLPVVAAHAAGHAEMLEGLDPRALFRPDDTANAAENLRALADDPSGRAALGEAERARQAATFSLDAQARATDAVYRRAIRGARR